MKKKTDSLQKFYPVHCVQLHVVQIMTLSLNVSIECSSINVLFFSLFFHTHSIQCMPLIRIYGSFEFGMRRLCVVLMLLFRCPNGLNCSSYMLFELQRNNSHACCIYLHSTTSQFP